jgi:diguanylate cyclase (GGDEF)-like protein
VCLADKRSRLPFDDADLGPLRFLADQVAQSIENALQFRQMQDLAAIDELTGLANRRQFQRSLEREVQRARRYDRQVTLAMFDVDHFKKYNDTCGHQAGDRALATIGEILRTSLRDVDIVARYGGEEFAVILPETAARPGAPVSPFPFLERLRRRIEEAVFPGEEKLPGGRLTVSGGVASFPDDAQTLEDLIRTADEALYVSKARGRNRITYRGSGLAE